MLQEDRELPGGLQHASKMEFDNVNWQPLLKLRKLKLISTSLKLKHKRMGGKRPNG